jgi:hypothetical protein
VYHRLRNAVPFLFLALSGTEIDCDTNGIITGMNSVQEMLGDLSYMSL